MKTILSVLLSFCLLQANAQTPDPKLTERLEEYMQLNRELKFAKLMEYIHPILFTLAPKEAILEAFEKGFDNDDIRISIDSITVTTISPVFTHRGASYHKVDYYMAMGLELKDKSSFEDSTFAVFMTEQLAGMFPGKKIVFDANKSIFNISGNDVLVAIKDNDKALWLFLGYAKSKAAVFSTLLPEPVIARFELK